MHAALAAMPGLQVAEACPLPPFPPLRRLDLPYGVTLSFALDSSTRAEPGSRLQGLGSWQYFDEALPEDVEQAKLSLAADAALAVAALQQQRPAQQSGEQQPQQAQQESRAERAQQQQAREQAAGQPEEEQPSLPPTQQVQRQEPPSGSSLHSVAAAAAGLPAGGPPPETERHNAATAGRKERRNSTDSFVLPLSAQQQQCLLNRFEQQAGPQMAASPAAQPRSLFGAASPAAPLAMHALAAVPGSALRAGRPPLPTAAAAGAHSSQPQLFSPARLPACSVVKRQLAQGSPACGSLPSTQVVHGQSSPAAQHPRMALPSPARVQLLGPQSDLAAAAQRARLAAASPLRRLPSCNEVQQQRMASPAPAQHAQRTAAAGRRPASSSAAALQALQEGSEVLPGSDAALLQPQAEVAGLNELLQALQRRAAEVLERAASGSGPDLAGSTDPADQQGWVLLHCAATSAPGGAGLPLLQHVLVLDSEALPGSSPRSKARCGSVHRSVGMQGTLVHARMQMPHPSTPPARPPAHGPRPRPPHPTPPTHPPTLFSTTGKTFQCNLAYKKLGIAPIVMSAGELESGNAGEPAKLIRQRYREASDIIKKGKMSSLFINDLDAGAGRMGDATQYTVNNQMVRRREASGGNMLEARSQKRNVRRGTRAEAARWRA